MPEKVSIPIASFDYTGEYSKPLLSALMERARIVEAVFESLSPWNIDIDNVEPVTTGKPSEQGINFRLPQKKILFFFGAGSCKFTKTDADWASAQETASVLSAATEALQRSSGAKIATQRTFIALHLQPKTKTFLEILAPFLSVGMQRLENSPVKAGASILKWDKRRVVFDGSGALANAVFVKFEREFDGEASFQQIATQLKADEDAIFRALDVEEDL